MEEKAEILTTNSNDVKTTPNTVLIIKKYYEKCGHSTTDYVEIPTDFVNKTKEELEKTYNEWQVKDFSSSEVTMFKYEKGFCNEHYVLREEDGIIVVYNIDENGNETIKEKTSVDTRYLPQTDLIAMKNGIYITDYMGASNTSINVVNGQISLQIFGFLVEDGKIVKGIEPSIMTTTIFELLNNIEEIGSDLTFTNTQVASPSIYIKDISIAR